MKYGASNSRARGSARGVPARWLRAAAAALLVGTLLAGCGSGNDNRPPTARPAEDTQKDFGNFEIHYNAVRTDELTPEIARAYGIERSGNRVLLNVQMLSKAPWAVKLL